MILEDLILNQLLHNSQYSQKVAPYLKEEYFTSSGARALCKIFTTLVEQYRTTPSVAAMKVELDRANVSEPVHDEAKNLLDSHASAEQVDPKWLLDQTEIYFRDRAIHGAISESIKILGDEAAEKGLIQELLKEALAVSFDKNLGHDYLQDAEARYEAIVEQRVLKVPFALDTLNRATNGGAERKSINVLIAGCVHPETPVIYRYEYEGVVREYSGAIRNIKALLADSSASNLQVKGPNGWVAVVEYVEKGLWQQYVIRTQNGKTLRCNEEHLVQYNGGPMISAKELQLLTSQSIEAHIITDDGPSKATCDKYEIMSPVVDLVLGDDEHLFYTAGIVSHNTNVGKSLMLCQLAADYMLAGLNVVYFTMEMSEEKIAQRVDANLIDVSLDVYQQMPKAWFLKKIEDIKKKTGGRFKVKEYPSSRAHIGHFRHHLLELASQDDFVPDVIIIDYLNITASSRYKPNQVARHLYVSAVTEEVRGFCQEFNAVGWTATQLNREGFGSSDASITETAEAFGLNFTADLVMVVSEPEHCVDLHQFQFRQEKSRYADKSHMKTFFMGVEKSKQRVYDLSDDGAKDEQHTPAADTPVKGIFD